jgi:ABC-type phosphate/phosphonate transport system substrate-binding protein
MKLLASLPMYDLPELRPAHDALWTAVARRLVEAGVAGVPATLTRDGAPGEHWQSRDLLLSQTCGYPLVNAFRGRLRVIATPRYAAPGCEGTSYSSAIVVGAAHLARRLEDLRGGVCAVNEPTSHSGMNALRAMIAPLAGGAPFFGAIRFTGAHVASLALVQAGAADVCAVDAVTHALLARHRPAALAGTRVLAMSPAAPALPYVTRGDAGDDLVGALRRALVAAIEDEPRARGELLLEGVSIVDDDAYERIRELADGAARAGYPELA